MSVRIHTSGDAPVLGRKVEDGRTHRLDTFDLPESVSTVQYVSDEVAAVCPVTGQPDWYGVTILLQGTKRGVESKSLKLYLQSYRNEGVFCEMFADEIAQDVMDATGANSVGVKVMQKPRGGITIEAHSTVWQTQRQRRARCDDGEGDVEQGVPFRGSTPPAEPYGQVP